MANHFENIDRYFGAEMGTEEMQRFENIVAQDPSLAKEFSFQQELVEGLQAARKAELKATLSKIDVSTIPTGSEISALTKILGGVAIAGIVAVGTYLYVGREEAMVTTTPAPMETASSSETTQQKTAIEQTIESSKENPVIVAIVEESNTSKQNSIVPIEKTADKKQPIVINEANVSERFEDEDEVSETEAPTNHLIAKSKISYSTLEVSIEESKRYSFDYQVKNNILSLYGDFSNLYEIIEFHKDGNITTYLKYDKKYYEINKLQSKVAPLVELTGDGLHNLLDSIENNKER